LVETNIEREGERRAPFIARTRWSRGQQKKEKTIREEGEEGKYKREE